MTNRAVGSRAVALSKNTGWYGRHSGFYEQIARRWAGEDPAIRTIVPRTGAWSRAIGKLHSLRLGLPKRNQAASAAELRFLCRFWTRRRAAGVVLNMDDHWPMLRWWQKAPRRLVGVIHFPTSIWPAHVPRDCARLSSAVVLWQRNLPEIESLVGPGRVRFVPHGVDADFFRPANTPRENDHLLTCGQFLRDFGRLETVFRSLHARRPGLRLTIIVSRHAANGSALEWTKSVPGVTLLSGISDEALRYHYQRCTALLMPLRDSGANNAILESLASGLPIITNDVGGIRDYGGGTVYPLADNNDDAFTELAIALLNDTPRLAAIETAQRKLALELGWDSVCKRLLAAVTELQAEPRT